MGRAGACCEGPQAKGLCQGLVGDTEVAALPGVPATGPGTGTAAPTALNAAGTPQGERPPPSSPGGVSFAFL